MVRAVIEVTPATRDAFNDARVDLFADAGQVLNANGRLLFLLAAWRYLHDNDPHGEWVEDARFALGQAGVSRQGRCRG